ncbi:MAG TPA: peptidylprolyl isomerase [Candidatus Limnocylindrales bacterium]|nr:peptidylprolyl isomerase [Candidatus Limnocylindrales bacterium]
MLTRIGRVSRVICMLGALTMVAACDPGKPGDDDHAKPANAPAATPAAAPASDKAPAADAAKNDGSPVIATYAGKSFTENDYKEATASLNARARKSLNDSPDRRKQFIENHILSKLIFEEGVKRGLDKKPEVRKKLDELQQHLVVQQVMEEQQEATVTDEDVKAYYDAHQQEFSTERVKASHILVDDEALARDIHAQVKADPSKFSELAAKHSKDLSNAKRGGDLGLFGRGRMVKEFEEAAFALQKDGDISEPVKTRFGWHIIQRTGREDGTIQPFDQVKNQIKVKLVSERRREKTTGFLEELKQKNQLKIDEAALASAKASDAPAEEEAAPAGGH